MFGADYVWILSNYDFDWWKTSTCCPLNHLKDAVEGSVHISPHYYGKLTHMNLVFSV